MVHKKIKFLTFFSFTILSTIQINAQSAGNSLFVLEGKIIGKDSGYVYLNYPINGKGVTDSCRLIKGKFIIQGVLSEPVFATFATFSPSAAIDEKNITSFYIEPTKMKLSTSINDFSNIKIKGSRSDSERVILERLQKPIEDSLSYFSEKINSYSQLYKGGQQRDSSFRKSKTNQKVIDSLNNQLKFYFQQRLIIDSIFILQHPDSYVAANMLAEYMRTSRGIMFPSVKAIFDRFPSKIKESTYGKEIARTFEFDKTVHIGMIAKNFVSTDMHNDTIELRRYKDKKYVLLDFWASWCAPCREVVPILQNAYEKYKDKLEIISISNENSEAQWENAIKNERMGWPQILENTNKKAIKPAGGTISDLYSILFIPEIIIIDKQSKVVGILGSNGENSPPMYLLNEKLRQLISD